MESVAETDAGLEETCVTPASILQLEKLLVECISSH